MKARGEHEEISQSRTGTEKPRKKREREGERIERSTEKINLLDDLVRFDN